MLERGNQGCSLVVGLKEKLPEEAYRNQNEVRRQVCAAEALFRFDEKPNLSTSVFLGPLDISCLLLQNSLRTKYQAVDNMLAPHKYSLGVLHYWFLLPISPYRIFNLATSYWVRGRVARSYEKTTVGTSSAVASANESPVHSALESTESTSSSLIEFVRP